MDNQFVDTGANNRIDRGGTAPAVHLDTMQQAAVSPPDTAQVLSATPPSPQALEKNSPPTQQSFTSSTATPPPANQPARLSPKIRIIGMVVIGAIVILSIVVFLIAQRTKNVVQSAQNASNFSATDIPLAGINSAGAITVNNQALSVNGQLRANGSLVMTPAAQPVVPTTGQIYYDQTSNHLKYFNGAEFVQIQTDKDAQGSTTNNTSNTTNATTVNNITNLSVTSGTVTTTNPVGGTTGRISRFTSGQTLGDSILTDSNTFLTVDGGINLNAATSTSDVSLYSSSSAPTVFDAADTNGSVELGVKFQVDVPGVIKAIRFYKGSAQSGTFKGSVWTNTGTLLGQATFTISGNGWQQVNFASPVPVSPDTTYIASYHQDPVNPTDVLGYPHEANAYGAAGIDNGPLHALASGIDGGNGLFRYTTVPAAPNETFHSTSYWVDVVFSGATYTDASRYRINNTQISSSDLANDANIAKRGSSQVFSGHNIFRNVNDSVNEFSIQRADTTELFSVDSTSNRVYIGKQAGSSDTLLILANHIGDDISNPSDGAMYYNATMGAYRCYGNGGWSNCSDLPADHAYSMYDEFLGGQVSALSQNDSIGSLGWKSQDIGGTSTISFNPATPAPSADRPGVLALQTPAVANQGTTLMLGNGSGSMLLKKNIVMKTAVAVGNTANNVLRVGLHNETSGTAQPISGVWWEADPAANSNWRYCYGNGTTATCASSGIAIAANSWMRLSISIIATGPSASAAFFTIGTSTFSVGGVTFDTANRVSPAFSCFTRSASSENVYWDYFQLSGVAAAAR